MPTFKPGDKVRCVHNYGKETVIKIGDIYTVADVSTAMDGEPIIWLKFPDNTGYLYAYYFVKVEG